MNPNDLPAIRLNYFKEVARLHEGHSFGELALLQNSGRAANIRCVGLTRFATLHKLDYNHTIGQETKRKLVENVSMLRNFKIFSRGHLRENVLEKIFRYMVTKKFVRGHLVYREGISHVDGVYFIKSGDFEISRKIGDKEKRLDQAKFTAAKRALSKKNSTLASSVRAATSPGYGNDSVGLG